MPKHMYYIHEDCDNGCGTEFFSFYVNSMNRILSDDAFVLLSEYLKEENFKSLKERECYYNAFHNSPAPPIVIQHYELDLNYYL